MPTFDCMHTYIVGDAFRRTASCDCGWTGPKRWSRGSAEVDAAIHEVQANHLQPEIPVATPQPVLALFAS